MKNICLAAGLGISALCGVSGFAALGGTDLTVVSEYNRVAGFNGVACSMAMLTDTIGLTAAHCVSAGGQPMAGLRALIRVDMGHLGVAGDYIGLKTIVPHPAYADEGKTTVNIPWGPYGRVFPHDLAVVELARAPTHPMGGPRWRLPSRRLCSDDALALLSLGSDGAQPPKKLAVLCKGAAGRVTGMGMIAAPAPGDFICPGDSGAPIFRLMSDGDYELAGIVSGGILNKPSFMIPTPLHIPRCGRDFVYETFATDVYAHVDWIKRTIERIEKGEAAAAAPAAAGRRLMEPLSRSAAALSE